MHRYANPENNAVLREADGAIIPCDPANSDYAALLAQDEAIAPFRRFADKNAAILTLIEAVKAECRRRILLIADEDRQRNLTARGVELTLAVAQGSLSQAGATELADLQALWGRIKALRSASDAKEADLQALPLYGLW